MAALDVVEEGYVAGPARRATVLLLKECVLRASASLSYLVHLGSFIWLALLAAIVRCLETVYWSHVRLHIGLVMP